MGMESFSSWLPEKDPKENPPPQKGEDLEPDTRPLEPNRPKEILGNPDDIWDTPATLNPKDDKMPCTLEEWDE